MAAGDINASVLYLNGQEFSRKDSDLGSAPTGTSYSFNNVPHDTGFLVDAYCWDMWVGDTARRFEPSQDQKPPPGQLIIKDPGEVVPCSTVPAPLH